MKIWILSFLLVCGVTSFAQSDKFKGAMEKSLKMLDSAKTTQDFQSVSNAFERIGDAEKTQWLPYYYAALAQTRIGWLDKSVDKDQLAIKINALCDKAEALDKNADLYTIRNMVATQQMMVDPSTRWQTYGQQASEALQKGMEMDPNNPRLYYLQGQSVFNTPPAYGGGKDKAKPIFEKAIELFKKESPKPLYPSWGLDQAQVMLAQCK